MSEIVALLVDDADDQTEGWRALNFVRGVAIGVNSYSDIYVETIYGPSTGLVYFVGIGAPYITHVKIGYTRKNPYGRMRDLQTGCPFKMHMLGILFGTIDREQELHDVLKEYRKEGEWFEYSEYVQQIIKRELNFEGIDDDSE